MNTVKRRILPFLAILACCAVVATFVSRANAQGGEEDWEQAVFEVEIMSMHLEMFGQLADLIQQMHGIAEDPSATGVMTVMSLEDHLQGDEATAFLEDMLNKTDDEAVQRMIRVKLIEFYEGEGDSDAALEHIEALIVG